MILPLPVVDNYFECADIWIMLQNTSKRLGCRALISRQFSLCIDVVDANANGNANANAKS